MSDVSSIPDKELIRRVISFQRPTRNFPLWVRVMDAFALGSTYAAQLCRLYGFNPDARKPSEMLVGARTGESNGT